MTELAHCTECGKLFVQTTYDLCPSCRQELEKKYETVFDYIHQKESQDLTVSDIHRATGVEENLLNKWQEEGKLEK
ncbi:hypothetical protein PU629_04290 [Pullulanibacillus sp. KACC 23026]|uniref:hypothetical protein n=1 Tax=Pullulanibacillus sp. KACC 23026 TaxID=3028315 RepID=UPI0023B08D2A|nr:hypothetical protein [Pullulanibacillus sp. KACC 23026]WEG13595.1 hypothetical protein PU629_04290 [Pullulanibacillus sp. KACC 23026]